MKELSNEIVRSIVKHPELAQQICRAEISKLVDEESRCLGYSDISGNIIIKTNATILLKKVIKFSVNVASSVVEKKFNNSYKRREYIVDYINSKTKDCFISNMAVILVMKILPVYISPRSKKSYKKDRYAMSPEECCSGSHTVPKCKSLISARRIS